MCVLEPLQSVCEREKLYMRERDRTYTLRLAERNINRRKSHGRDGSNGREGSFVVKKEFDS